MSSSFIWRAYNDNGHKEPGAHRMARLRVGGLLWKQVVGVIPHYDKEIRVADDWPVYPDIFWNGIDIELDGESHNTTSRKYAKDESRDRALAAIGIRTVRLLVEDVNGRKLKSGKYFKLRDDEILAMVK